MKKENRDNAIIPPLPREFCRRMRESLGKEAEAFFATYEQPGVKSLRLNPLKTPGEVDITRYFPTATTAGDLEGCCRYYGGDDRPGAHPLHAAGLYYIQEASAMAPVSLLMRDEVGREERILDLCAAPGGKTTQIGAYMKGRGVLVANEIVPSRAKILSENTERMGIVNAVITNHSPAELSSRFEGFFSRILVDAPCSGEGMFRKNPLSRLEWSLDNVRMCALRQREILAHAADMLADGGTLVYSTCTFSEAEDEAVIEDFLRERDDFELVDIIQMLSGAFRDPSVLEGQGDRPGIRLFPHRYPGEGHYMAMVRKKGGVPGFVPESAMMKSGGAKSAAAVTKEALGLWRDFLSDNIKQDYVNDNPAFTDPSRLALFGDSLWLLPPLCPAVDGLKTLRCGLHLGQLLKNRLEPSHALAMALKAEDFTRSVQTGEDEAAAYLSGMTPDCAGELRGWTAVCFDGYVLGWGKAGGGRIKNHYPKGLRREFR